jgi:hypothetical protein
LGFIKQAKSLRIKDGQEVNYKKGITFEKIPELLTRGHHVNENRLGLLEENIPNILYFLQSTLSPRLSGY